MALRESAARGVIQHQRALHLFLLLVAVALPVQAGAPGARAFGEQQLWSLNVGGAAFETRAGDLFAADDCGRGDGICDAVPAATRTQNGSLYSSFRRGDQQYAVALDPGQYDVVLYFLEPSASQGKSRRFDVLLEGEAVLHDFSPLREKGSSAAAVTRSFSVAVDDGSLDIAVQGRHGAALLSGILVRRSRFGTGGWERVWSDEFDGRGLDDSSWTAEVWAPRRVNDEDQAYTAESRNVRVEDGLLVLEAHYQGEDEPRFTSGRVHSRHRRELLYGRVDVRARVPEGRGVWPAIWLMPSDHFRYATTCGPQSSPGDSVERCDAWPNSGEIDLMEHVGNEPGVVHGTVHTRDFYHRLDTQVGEAIVLPDLGRAFHVYTLVWEPGALAMYVDGQRYFAYFDDGAGIGQWPFDHPFYVILNLAVGGWWGRARGGIDVDAFPRRLEVDYVRMYRAPDVASAGAAP